MKEKDKLLSCRICGNKPIIEHWSSSGRMYMVKCNNPDCAVPDDGYPTGHDLQMVKEKWNRRQSCG